MESLGQVKKIRSAGFLYHTHTRALKGASENPQKSTAGCGELFFISALRAYAVFVQGNSA